MMEEINKSVSGDIKKIQIEETETPKVKIWRRRPFWLGFGIVFILFLFLVVNGLFIGFKAKGLLAEVGKLEASAKTKDLKLIGAQITVTKNSLNGLEESLRPLFWVGFIPFVGHYQQDAVHLVRAGRAGLEAGEIVVAAVAPYADMIGFAGGENLQGGEKTAEDRINFLVTTLDKINPDLDRLAQKAIVAQEEMEQVDPKRYPQTIGGKNIREPLKKLIDLTGEVAALTNDAQPLLKKASWFLGTDTPRRYLLILQNDGELRPTGGFLTAYAILEVDKGKIKPLLSEDIYTLDAKYKPTKEAPEVLKKYVSIPYAKDPRWRLRDMNLSADFAQAMELFLPEFQKVSKEKFDGVISVDTQVMTNLLTVLGTVGVSGWGNFSAEPDKRCDGCPQVVYELEKLITQPLNRIVLNRKAILGPLMHSLLANAFGSPKEKLPDLFEAAFLSARGKHVLFYFSEPQTQAAIESFNVGGRVKDYTGDYFYLNETSFSGAKVNIFIKQQVEQKIEIDRQGTITKTVTIQYKNPSPASDCNLERGGLCLNAPYRDWVRLYVPQGSQLVDSSGLETEIKTYDELGKTVFEGFFGDQYPLRPEGQAKISFVYKLPFKAGQDYRILIQKQSGAKEPIYLLDVNGQKEEFPLKEDKELKFKL